MKIFARFIITVLISVPVLLQAQSIQWMSIEEAVEKNQQEPRKIFVDVYTDWCGWCKKMDNSTFKDSTVVAYINKHFYAVKLNAETSDTIRIGDNIYVNPNPGKRRSSHQLARLFLQGNMVYPSYALFTEEMRSVMIAKGYMKTQKLLPILKFVAEDHYKTQSWQAYLEATGEESK